jgi:hypothetical protein
MTLRRHSLAFLAIAWPVLSAACELIVEDLPDPVQEGAGGTATAGKGGGGGLDAGIDSGGLGGSAGGGNAGDTGGNAGTSGDTGTSGTAGTGGSGCLDPCDCDGDSDRAESCAGGADCDDRDPAVRSTQTDFFATPSLRLGFDYNCDGRSEPQHVLIDCGLLGLSNCEQPEGYLGTLPPCGEPGRWGGCKWNLLCGEDVRESARVLLCR